jgi:hypothetical protein
LGRPDQAEDRLISDARLSQDGRTLTVRVPMAITKHGGRKSVISPDGVSSFLSSRPQVDSTLVKALARAFRWRRLLETGVYATIDEMAAAEKINGSYVSRVLRLPCEFRQHSPASSLRLLPYQSALSKGMA